MIAHHRMSPPSFSKRDNNNSVSVLVDQFLKEAIQILKHADLTLNSQPHSRHSQPYEDPTESETDTGGSDDNDAVTWQLNLTPTMMTLDTSISTVSGLEKVLELIRINVKPQPARLQREKRLVNSDRYHIASLQRLIEPMLRLSMVMTMPRTDQLQQQFNSMQLMRHSVQSFIHCGQSYFIDIPSLLANTDMILSQPGAAKEHTVETLLILSICTFMIRHSTIHHRGDMTVGNVLMHTYYAQARQLLQDLFDVHHISVVQSMFILSVFPQGHTHLFSPARVASPLLNMTVRMALAMDLHKLDLRPLTTKESDQKEKLRRLAWLLFCSDYYADWNSTGRTGRISVHEWHVDFPQPLPSEKYTKGIEYLSQYCRVLTIRKMELFKSAYMISLRSSKALRTGLDEQLFQTYFNTPDTFKLNQENQSFSTNDIESLLLHELYSHTHIFARLPFLPSRYIQDFVAREDIARCADLNDIYQRIVRSNAPFATLQKDQFSPSAIFQTEGDLELEFYFIVGLLTVMNNYTHIMEALLSIDPIGCHHSPVYGTMLTCHLYIILFTCCADPEIRSVCQINLMRTSRLLKQARTVYADPTILFLERMLSRYQIVAKEDVPLSILSKRTFDIMRSLQSKSSYLHHAYEDDEDEEDEIHVKLE